MNGINNQIYSLEQAASQYLSQKSTQVNVNDASGISFEDVFKQRLTEQSNEITFSKHASDRLESRNINLTDSQVERLNGGVKQAKEKNINESLVMMDNLAFIVSVNNNTVITAMDQDSNDSNIFTNIDGAVIV